jgi:hypothetical protein
MKPNKYFEPLLPPRNLLLLMCYDETTLQGQLCIIPHYPHFLTGGEGGIMFNAFSDFISFPN